MKNEYLTTTQAAVICHVTRFTIANWEKSGKLKTNKTAGGHRRILKKNLISFITHNRIAEIDRKDEEMTNIPDRCAGNIVGRIPSCWEFRFKNRYTHNCIGCLVFKERANKCFLTTREFGRETVKCQDECLDCEYLNTYYPAKKKIIEKTRNDMMNRARSIVHKRGDGKRGDGTSTFFKKGLYVSGKYVASIEKTIFRKEKKRVSAF